MIVLPNCLDFVAAFFGAQAVGVVPVPAPWPFALTDQGAAAKQLAPMITAAAPHTVITSDRLAEGLAASAPSVLTSAGASQFDGAVFDDPAHPAFLQFTSGTTGDPRGATIAHAAAMASASMMGEALELSESDVGVSWLPLFHDMGLVGVLLSSLVRRFGVHIMTPDEFLLRPRRWLELVTSASATLTVGPNFAYDLVTRRIRSTDGLDLSALRLSLNGSEPVHRRTIEGFEGRFEQVGLRRGTSMPVYGLAENTLGVSFADPHRAAPDLDWQGRAVPSVGTPLANTEVQILDGTGRQTPVGEEGDIAVRSPSVMSGYFRDEGATAKCMRGDWLMTGDLGVIRGDQLYVTGRKKDLVIKGGRKFHPYEIERVVAEDLVTTPNGVAAFSMLNDQTGTEDLVVAIELRGPPDPLLEKRLRGRVMEALGIRPDAIHVVPPGRLPRTTSGKVRRRACPATLATEIR